MDDDPEKIADIPLHRDAKALIKEQSLWFGTALTTQAKFLARINGHDTVLPKHVRDAFEVLRGPRPRPWKNEVASTLGGVLLGLGASSFISEVSRSGGPRPLHITAFTLLAFVAGATVLIASITKR